MTLNSENLASPHTIFYNQAMSKMMFFKIHRFCLILALLFSTVGCDQVTKVLARDTLADRSLSYFGDSIRLQHAENPGAFLSLGANLPTALRFSIFTVAVFLFLAGALWYLWKNKNHGKWPTVAITLIVAGGIGNLIDRAFKGTVTDFLNLGFGWFRTGIFNIADVAIVTGVLIFFFLSLRKSTAANRT